MTTSERGATIELTTRNRLPGVVKRVTIGSVPAEVVVGVAGHEVVAAVPRHSVERLALGDGDQVTVFAKATEVMLGKEIEV